MRVKAGSWGPWYMSSPKASLATGLLGIAAGSTGTRTLRDFDPATGRGSNWVPTVPDKGWFTVLRLYGPLEPWFDRTWRPGDIRLVD